MLQDDHAAFARLLQYMPELAWEHGYPLVMAGMAALAIGILVILRLKRWI
ncbi:MAG: hypothetical protein KJZ95_18150 [Caldilinea sp.]|nr:hypothetical protein [Caldilinea sp.]